ncbi:hypothetical protein DO71_3862 [Burkholderia pseudomallei]|nr:hypothetical protein DO71_3862 [Burkholderia pseudomallei]
MSSDPTSDVVLIPMSVTSFHGMLMSAIGSLPIPACTLMSTATMNHETKSNPDQHLYARKRYDVVTVDQNTEARPLMPLAQITQKQKRHRHDPGERVRRVRRLSVLLVGKNNE